jgi:hypothetical protein
MKLIKIIRNNIQYEVLTKTNIHNYDRPVIKLNYNNNLDLIINQIKIHNLESKRITNIFDRILKILELIKKYKKELNFDYAAYICFYDKSLNILKLENNNIIYNSNFIIIIDMCSIMYDLEKYKKINKKLNYLKLFCILAFTGISLIIINKLFFAAKE